MNFVGDVSFQKSIPSCSEKNIVYKYLKHYSNIKYNDWIKKKLISIVYSWRTPRTECQKIRIRKFIVWANFVL